VTEISFYSHAPDRLSIARQLVAKACSQKLNVLIYAPDESVAASIDQLLWTQPALSFIPHCRDDSPLASVTPVIIGKSADALPSADVLINLDSEPPPVFSRFDRLIEIVTEDASDVLNGRQRYRFYKDRGYELVNHDLRGSNR
jgi:DNA polymerase-3 subunit chi